MRAPAGVVPLVALFAACTVYVALFPNHLGDSDEPLILYEAKRVLDGAVMYRDVFEIITPGSQYFFAGLFGLFGATLTTARMGMALVHAAIATLIAVACRRCEVRWPLAIAAAVAHLALGQPVWPYASPHWLGTLLTMLALVLALGRPWAADGRGGLALGAVLGGLAMVQQQKAALLLPAVVLAMLADHLVDRRYPPPVPQRSLPAQLAALLAGVMLVAAPVMLAIVALAGVAPVFDALIRHPLTSYPALHAASARWGSVSIFSLPLAWYTRPALLRWQPLVMLGVGLRVAVLWWRRAGEAEVRRLVILLFFAGGATASIMYFPDFIHLAFIAPLFVVGLAALLEVGVRRLPRLLVPVVCVVLLLALGVQATRNLRRAHATHTVRAETRFGRLDLRNRQLLDAAAEMDRLLPPNAPREVFCYPECPALYLLAGADNPTPYQKLLTGYNSPEMVQAAIAAVEARRPPLAFGFFAVDTDPVTHYVLAHYTRVGTSLFYTRNADAN